MSNIDKSQTGLYLVTSKFTFVAVLNFNKDFIPLWTVSLELRHFVHLFRGKTSYLGNEMIMITQFFPNIYISPRYDIWKHDQCFLRGFLFVYFHKNSTECAPVVGIPALTKNRFAKNGSYEVLTPEQRYVIRTLISWASPNVPLKIAYFAEKSFVYFCIYMFSNNVFPFFSTQYF